VFLVPHGIAGRGVVDWFAVAVSCAAFIAMQFFRAGIIPVVVASGALGLAWSLLG
jgi:hypothetical protein